MSGVPSIFWGVNLRIYITSLTVMSYTWDLLPALDGLPPGFTSLDPFFVVEDVDHITDVSFEFHIFLMVVKCANR